MRSTWKKDGLKEIDRQFFNDIWGWADGTGREYAIMGSLDSIYFIDVTDPANPIEVDAEPGRDVNCIHRDFKTYKHYCFAVADEGFSSLQVFDLQYLPDSVHKVYDSDEFGYRAHNIFIEGSKLYLAANLSKEKFSALRVLNIENPSKPKLLFDLEAQGINLDYVHDIYVRNDTAICSGGEDGIYVFNVFDSIEKSGSKFYAPGMELTGGMATYPNKGYNHSSAMDKTGKYIYFADENHGLALKVMAQKDNRGWSVVKEFGHEHEKGSIAHNPFVNGDLLYVSYYQQGVQVYDISVPDSPVRVGFYDTYPRNMGFDGLDGCWGVYPYLPSGNIIASDQYFGLYVFGELSSISRPQKVSVLNVYPNPVSLGGIMGLNLEKPIVSISLHDLNGKLIKSFPPTTRGNEPFNIQFPENLVGGTYQLRVETKNELLSKLIIAE
ncbi:MAG: choice-of-anchor B family protein [Bacteroidetes bacterium]|nr:choice-of-anchor B family protein [Bacteroidota bacterium]